MIIQLPVPTGSYTATAQCDLVQPLFGRDSETLASVLIVAPFYNGAKRLWASLQQEVTAGWLFGVDLISRLSARLADRRNPFCEFPLAERSEITGSRVTARITVESGFRMLRLVVESRIKRAPSSTPDLSTTKLKTRNLTFDMLFSRWMGPALFGGLAIVLIIKLVLLGILGAVEMAATRHIATHGNRADRGLAQLNRIGFVSLWFAAPVLLMLIEAGGGGERLGKGQPALLLIVLIFLAFAASLCVMRGIFHCWGDIQQAT